MDGAIRYLIVQDTGEEHDDIQCPVCKYSSRPYGLAKASGDKIQLVRQCRSCSKLFWYWANIEGILSRFGE